MASGDNPLAHPKERGKRRPSDDNPLALPKAKGMVSGDQKRTSGNNPLALLKWKGQGSASAATPDPSWVKGAGEGKW